ncbi:methylenetetrahydrofolate reductase [NAD(P)H] [Anatilimnocola floriformis]|uniref:methylenetetrahydrofolate reductase [NAD(P)H] n=1 Tax=Anatilimnocola floriformis TaxID=2948575 RepID=UPI0020C472A8|nr:methylenetetrahydrofolate reductase [NAD(P)H] [Anatilimnocola floriformis]
MNLREHYRDGRFGLSFEIFPPKSAEGEQSLRSAIGELARWQPAFISCTYGAVGSTNQRTLDWCRVIQQEASLPAVAHLTCLESTTAGLCDWLHNSNQSGVVNFMALRGDRPKVRSARPGDFEFAYQLVELIRSKIPTAGIGVAGYPEKHPEAADEPTDLQHTARKVRAGADAIYTQLFFDNQRFLRYRDSLAVLGVEVPIVPGLMPITEYDRVAHIANLCGTFVPQELADSLERVKHDRSAQYAVGLEYSVRQTEELLREGVPGIHFYTLNKAGACLELLEQVRSLIPQRGDKP